MLYSYPGARKFHQKAVVSAGGAAERRAKWAGSGPVVGRRRFTSGSLLWAGPTWVHLRFTPAHFGPLLCHTPWEKERRRRRRRSEPLVTGRVTTAGSVDTAGQPPGEEGCAAPAAPATPLYTQNAGQRPPSAFGIVILSSHLHSSTVPDGC